MEQFEAAALLRARLELEPGRSCGEIRRIQ
jgi:hypothetical protein